MANENSKSSSTIFTKIPAYMGSVQDSEIFKGFSKQWGNNVKPYIYFSREDPTSPAMYICHWITEEDKQVRPFCVEGNARLFSADWVSAFIPENRPLFNLPELMDPKKGHWPVLVVEGEKAASAAKLMCPGVFSDSGEEIEPGYIVVTSSGGANGAYQTDWTLLIGRSVLIACDYDEAGLRYGDDVYRILKKLGVECVEELPWSIFIESMMVDGSLVTRLDRIPKGYDLADIWMEGKRGNPDNPGWELRAMIEVGNETGGFSIGYIPHYNDEEDIHRTKKPYRTVTPSQILDSDIPETEVLMGSWLTTKSSNMIFAKPGIGKSFLALNIGLSIATGKDFLGWQVPKSAEVLYIDGEMDDVSWRKRLKEAGVVSGATNVDNLKFISRDFLPDETGRKVPNLFDSSDRDRVEDSLTPDTKLLILDNESCLATGADESDGVAWGELGLWIEKLKHDYGLAVILVHHAGKGGSQRGTSKREDAMATIISLKRPEDYEPSQRARFDLEFTKGRSISEMDAAGMQVHLKDGEWITTDLDELRTRLVLDKHRDGLKNPRIAEDLGISLSAVERIIRLERDMGNLERETKRKGPTKSVKALDGVM